MNPWEDTVSAYLPTSMTISEVGWKKFLERWSAEAMASVRTIMVYHGLSPGSTDEQLQYLEKISGLSIPRTMVKGIGLRYPGQNVDEQRRIDLFLREMREYVLAEHSRSSIRDYNDEMIASDGAWRDPCAVDDIKEAEQRLGILLPESYKGFLRASNGWLLKNSYLLSVSQIDWYRNSKWASWFSQNGEFLPENVPDNLCFTYGQQQHPVKRMRREYISSLLLLSETISDVRDLQFLNPKVISEDGEWEAATMFGGGFVRFRSFAEMMESLYLRDIAHMSRYIAKNVAVGEKF